MKLLIITQKVDETDDLLGFFVAWIREFSKYYDHVEVITLGKGEYSLPDNVVVHSLGKERGVSKFRQLFTFYFLLFTLMPKSLGVFCHMSPVFAIIAWPFAKIYRTKLVLWYLHRSVTLKLRIALHLVNTLVTADAQSLNIKSSKIVSTGHGIDTERFAVQNRTFDISQRPLRIISVGRLSPIKDFGTLIRATAILKEKGKDIEVHIIGRPVMTTDYEYTQELHAMVEGLGLKDIVRFIGFIPYRNMPEQYAWADIVVGGTPKGGLDKAILEGMAAGCIPITSNEAMRAHLGVYGEKLMYNPKDSSSLYEKLSAVVPNQGLSDDMVKIVKTNHALENAIRKITTYI